MRIVKATAAALPALCELALKLWPEHTREEMLADLEALTALPDAAFFLAMQDDAAVGFAQCQLRRDYVEGTSTTPVGYLEGIFVEEPFRRRGIARELLSACENWARTAGCREFASDCELSNEQSLLFHLALGFQEANRIICFTRTL